MKYASIRDLRVYLQFYPIKVEGEVLGVADGDNAVFHTASRPIVDPDYDGRIIDDVAVRVDGEPADISDIDPEVGRIVLRRPPPVGSKITCDYYWHPLGDQEISRAIEAAEHDIDNQCGRSFEVRTVSERIYVPLGNRFTVSYTPLLRVLSLEIEGPSGEVVERLGPGDYVFQEDGLVILKRHCAGVPSPPWYLPSRFHVRITYEGGYAAIPGIVSQATVLLSSYYLLSKLSFMLTSEPEYQGKVAVAFKRAEDLTRRLEILRAEVERMIVRLPKRVAVV